MSINSSPTLMAIKKYKKNKLRELLEKCTKKQQAFFGRMYGSIAKIPDGKIDWAIRQCEATIKKNVKAEES